MKKTRLFLATAAILIAVGLAASETVSAKADPPCSYQQQYYKSGYNYFPTGTLGLHYVCFMVPYACTYYLPDPVLQPDNYVPCRQGTYHQMQY